MKKILLSLLCIFSVFTLFAQTVETETTAEPTSSTETSSVERQHLTFKGIPIDGTPEEFGRKLEAVGFEYNLKVWAHIGIKAALLLVIVIVKL